LLDPEREPLLLEALMNYAAAAWDFNKSILGSDETFQHLPGAKVRHPLSEELRYP